MLNLIKIEESNQKKLIHTECTQLLNKISSDHALRCRSYRTLGLCTGAALIILFI